MLSCLLVLGLLGACSSGASQSEEGAVIDGTAVVVDGDGVEIDGRKIRLFGIDAPETDQYCKRDDGVRWRCGQYSTVELDRLAGGRRLSCEVKDIDSYDRPVAVCRVGDRDIAAEQGRGGWASAYGRSSDRYSDLEDEARGARRGVWQGAFEKPWDWRRRMREK